MKERCIMIFPQFDNMNIIDNIRGKYDPLAHHVKPHITLVFPFRSNIQTSQLKEHLNRVLSSIRPFGLTLKGFMPVSSFGNYLFLNIEDGKDEIIKIHKNLYTDILEPYHPVWLKSGGYHPHMTVGKIEDQGEFKVAGEVVRNITDTFQTTVTKVSIEIIDDNQDSIVEMEVTLNNELI